MAKGISGKRHAQAVFQIALETGQLEQWQADIDRIATFLGDEEIAVFLANPRVSPETRRALLDRGLEGISPLAMNLARFLVAKKRLRIVQDIASEYRRLLNAHQGIELADVTTAVSIGDQEADRIGKGLASIAGKRILLDLRVDPDILGGFVARVGDKLIDGSARTRLQQLKKSLA